MMLLASALMLLSLVCLAAAEQCGRQAANKKCPNNMCCSQYGYCGTTNEYCGEGCQSQCHKGGLGINSGKAGFYGPPYVRKFDLERPEQLMNEFGCVVALDLREFGRELCRSSDTDAFFSHTRSFAARSLLSGRN